jgi:CRP-like cAMP-binding protein
VFTVIGASCLMAYLYFRPDPLITAVCWNVVFVLLNLYWIGRLILERRPVRLSEDERRLCALAFRTITPREMTNLLKLGTWERGEPGQHLSQRGAALDRLMLIYSGTAAVEVESQRVGVLQPGQFVGSISFITEETATADVIALEPIRYVAWPKAKLKSYLAKNPELHAAIEVMLGGDLAHRLQDCWTHQKPCSELAQAA